MTDLRLGFDAAQGRVAASLSVVSGRIRPEAMTVYALMRNERFLLPAFLHHYRSLGAEQFLILSDRSDDGTTELIRSQPDCVLLASTFAYGDWLDLPAGGPVRRRRAGVLMKSVIPRVFLEGSVGVYADADEFLVLPPPMRSLQDVVAALRAESADAVHAAMVEMYPERFSDLLEAVPPPGSLGELVDVAPFFDAHPLLRPGGGDARPTVVGESASTRLFRHFAIGERRRVLDPLPLPLRRRFTTTRFSSAVAKTPVVRFRPGVDHDGSHEVRGGSSCTALLGLLHFKFTPDSLLKVERIIAEKSHSRNSIKYVGYRELFAEMRRKGGSFMGPTSTRYEGPGSLERCALIHGPGRTAAADDPGSLG